MLNSCWCLCFSCGSYDARGDMLTRCIGGTCRLRGPVQTSLTSLLLIVRKYNKDRKQKIDGYLASLDKFCDLASGLQACTWSLQQILSVLLVHPKQTAHRKFHPQDRVLSCKTMGSWETNTKQKEIWTAVPDQNVEHLAIVDET